MTDTEALLLAADIVEHDTTLLRRSFMVGNVWPDTEEARAVEPLIERSFAVADHLRAMAYREPVCS